MSCFQQSHHQIIRYRVWQKLIANVPPGLNRSVDGTLIASIESMGGFQSVLIVIGSHRYSPTMHGLGADTPAMNNLPPSVRCGL